MSRAIATAAAILVLASLVVAQENTGTTTGGPLTVAGVPLYGVGENGDLYWYFHRGAHDGSASWANRGQRLRVGGPGWNEGLRVFKGNPHGVEGVIYRVDSRGDLYWYRHTGSTDGSFNWSNGASGVKVGNGWNDAASAFSGGDGVIYALKRDGNLYWYNHTGYASGAVTWSSPAGNQIGTGWGEMVRIF